jgi:hypothetical protein
MLLSEVGNRYAAREFITPLGGAAWLCRLRPCTQPGEAVTDIPGSLGIDLGSDPVERSLRVVVVSKSS